MASEEEPFRVRIQLSEHESCPCNVSVPLHLKESFSKDGFVVLPHVFDRGDVNALNDRLEEVLRGRYDRNQAPDKSPRLIKNELLPNYNEFGLSEEAECRRAKSLRDATAENDDDDNNNNSKTIRIKKKTTSRVGPLGFSGNFNNVRVLQVINVHKCDRLFRSVAVSRTLGKLVAELAGWQQGARLAQDQVWAKPPGGKQLVFHQDSPYFMFDPPHVVTVWIALDDMDEELGPIEYVRGSHLWGDGSWESSNEFFEADGGQTLLRLAADRAGVTEFEMTSVAGLASGERLLNCSQHTCIHSYLRHHVKRWHFYPRRKNLAWFQKERKQEPSSTGSRSSLCPCRSEIHKRRVEEPPIRTIH